MVLNDIAFIISVSFIDFKISQAIQKHESSGQCLYRLTFRMSRVRNICLHQMVWWLIVQRSGIAMAGH